MEVGNKIFILLLMIFLHIVDDYYLQGWLASAKQKSYWEQNAPDKLYKYDSQGNSPMIANYDGAPTSKGKACDPLKFRVYRTEDGKEFNIRIDQNVALYDPETNEQILTGEYFMGKTFKSITGILCYYNGNPDNPKYSQGKLQLALTDMADVVFE